MLPSCRKPQKTSDLDNFQLVFDPDEDYAEFGYTTKEHDIVNYQVGLDNVYRLTESNGDTYAAVGAWTMPDTFCIEYELVGYSNRGKWRLVFEDDEIAVEEVGVTGEYAYRGKRADIRRNLVLSMLLPLAVFVVQEALFELALRRLSSP